MAITPPVTGTAISTVAWGIPVTTELNRLTPIVDASTTWTAYTPTISQGTATNIAKNVDFSKFARSGPTGKIITCVSRVTITGTGVAGNQILWSPPVTPLAIAGMIGAGMVYDSSTGSVYAGTWYGWLSTSVTLINGAGGFWGATPSLALASGDSLGMTMTYEAA